MADQVIGSALAADLIRAEFNLLRAQHPDPHSESGAAHIEQLLEAVRSLLRSQPDENAESNAALAEVKRAAQCDILVGEDEVKVRALEGYHDVTVSIPPEAKGSAWRRGSDAWVMRAKFELKTEKLTVSLRTPAAAMARGAASPLGDEKENAKKGNAKNKNENGGATGASTVPAARAADAPFSPVTPNRSVAADKAAAAVKAAASARKKRV